MLNPPAGVLLVECRVECRGACGVNIRSGFIVLLLLLSAPMMWAGSAQAGPTAEKVRASLEAQAIENTKRISAKTDRRVTFVCKPLFHEIEKLHQKHRCSGHCDEKIKTYDAALNEHWLVTEAFALNFAPTNIYKKGFLPEMALGVCLRVAVKEKDHVASYGVGRMMTHNKSFRDRLTGALWTYTSLTLGKGVARSKREAVQRLIELSNSKEADKKSKNLLLYLIAKEQMEK